MGYNVVTQTVEIIQIMLVAGNLTCFPVKFKKTFTPDRTFKGEILTGDPTQVAQVLVESLKQKQII